MRRVRIPLAVLFPLVLSAVPTTRAETRPGYGGRPVVSLGAAPTTLDPVEARTPADVALVGLVYDTLYRLDESGRPVPHLALSRVERSADGKKARILLRPGVRFHDGRELTATDVAASLRRAAGSPATAWALAAVERIEPEPAADALMLRLSRPAPELDEVLALPQLAITPGGRAPRRGAPVGSGPFALARVDWSRRHVELVAWDDHFAGRPYVDGLVLRWFEQPGDEARAYEAGESDLSWRGDVAFAGHVPKYPTAVTEGPTAALAYVGFGRARAGFLSDVDFRRAVSLAMNRRALRHLGTGERLMPALSPVPAAMGGPPAPDAALGARLDAARDALRRAAARHLELDAALAGRRTPPLEVLADRSRPEDAEIAARVVAALDRLGLAASFAALEPGEFARRVETGECDLYVGQLAVSARAAALVWAAALAAGGEGRLARRLAANGSYADAAARAFEERAPIVPLVHRAARVHHRTTLRALAFDALGRIGFADFFVGPIPAAGATR